MSLSFVDAPAVSIGVAYFDADGHMGADAGGWLAKSALVIGGQYFPSVMLRSREDPNQFYFQEHYKTILTIDRFYTRISIAFSMLSSALS